MIERERDMEGQVTEQEKMFKKYLFMTSNKGLLSKIHKGLLKLNSKETNTLVVKMGDRSEQTAHQRRYTDYMKRCSTSFLMRERQTKTTRRYLCAPSLSLSDSLQPLQAPLSMESSRQEYQCGSQFPTPGDLPDPGIKPTSFESPAFGRQILHHGITWEAQDNTTPLSADGQHPEHRLHQALERIGSDKGAHSLLAGM